MRLWSVSVVWAQDNPVLCVPVHLEPMGFVCPVECFCGTVVPPVRVVRDWGETGFVVGAAHLIVCSLLLIANPHGTVVGRNSRVSLDL